MLDRRVVTFLRVAESGSITKAARLLYLSKVSVKAQMDSLEAEVGVRLLERTTRGIRLTPAGELFNTGAQKLAFLSERTLSTVRAADAGKRHVIRVGTSVLRPCRPLLELWDSLGSDKPDITFEIVPFDDDTTSLNEIADELGRRIDCFVAPCDSDHWRATANILLLDELAFCLAVPRNHPLSRRNYLTWDDLDGETIMMVPGSDSPLVREIREEIKAMHPLISLVTSPTHYDITTFNACEQAGYLLPTYRVWSDVHPSMATIPVKWPWTMPYGLVYSKRPSEDMRAFAQAIKAHLTTQQPEAGIAS